MHNKYLLSTPLGLLIITVLVGVFLNSTSTSATTASTALASVKVAASCTLTTSGGGNYSAIVPNGTSAEISGSTLTVSCNDAGGFALYAVGYSNDTVGNNNMIGSSTNIVTNTSGNDSYWAMKINPTSGTTPTIENSFNNYHIVPDIHTKIASYASSTGTGSLSVNATYKANISSTQLAGNYLGKVKYTLVHPANEVPPHEVACEARRICYNANTNIVEGQMGYQPVAGNASTVTFYAPNFKRDGYGFAGWTDKYDYETNPYAHFFGPQETIPVPSDIQTSGLSLYAVWIESVGFMQDKSAVSSICSRLAKSGTNKPRTLDSVSALTDTRDNNTYAIAKLADGGCWMIENLRLDDSAILTSFNTNNPSLPLLNTDNTTSNHLSPTTDPTQIAWCTTNSSDCMDRSMLATNNTTLFVDNTASSYSISGNVYSYGNYYNWYSATAGHGKYGSEYGSGYSALGDICPAGNWYLPTGDNSVGDFSSLDIALGGTGAYQSGESGETMSKAYRSYPNNFIYSGSLDSSLISNRGLSGGYLSSSGGGSVETHGVYFSDGGVDPSGSEYKYIGRMIRCRLYHK